MCKERNNSNNNKDDSIRKSITFTIKKDNRNDTNETNETSKVSNKITNIVDKNKVNNE